MKNKKARELDQYVGFRLSSDEFKKLRKTVEPYGSVAKLLRALVRQYLEKQEKQNAA